MKDHLPPVPLDDTAQKITAIETARPDDVFPHVLFCRIHTDQGIVGCGEGYYLPEAIEAVVHEWARKRLVGGDALAIESHWRFLYERTANIACAARSCAPSRRSTWRCGISWARSATNRSIAFYRIAKCIHESFDTAVTPRCPSPSRESDRAFGTRQ